MDKETPTPTEKMNATYRVKAPKFPEHLRKSDSDNILLYMMQRIPMKVCMEKKHVLVI